MSTERRVQGATIRVVRGDITTQEVDAVVNAANEHLRHGGGVAAAIARAGGPTVQAESDRWVDEHGPLATGRAAVTGGGDLPARWVVHTVGPRWSEDQDNEGLLRSAVSAAMEAAAGAGARSVAFPAISAGVFGYPRDEATAVIADEVTGWLEEHPGRLEEVLLVGFDEGTAADFAVGLGS